MAKSKPNPKVGGKSVTPKNQQRPVTGKNVKQTPKGAKGNQAKPTKTDRTDVV